MRLPSGQRVGEEHACALGAVIRQRRVEVLHGQADLQVCDDERRGHDLESEHPLGCCLPHRHAGERTEALFLEVGGDAAEHFR